MSSLKVGIMLAVVALTGVWLLTKYPETREVAAPALPSVSIATALEPHARDAHGTPGLYVADSDPTRPDLTIESALGAARAGDTAAMRALSQALKLCASLQATNDEAVVAKELRLAEFYKQFARDTGAKYDSNAVDAEFELKAAQQLQVKKLCDSIPEKDVSDWLHWLEKAAAAGDASAKLEYGSAVLARTADVNWIYANLQETARQKQRAFHFLKELADSGDCTVSTQMEILAPTPTMAYAYSLVSLEQIPDQSSVANAQIAAENVAFMQRQVDMKAAKLSATERESARAFYHSVLGKCR